MTPLKKIFIPALFILYFSCRTPLENEGWIRTPVLTQFDTSVLNKKDKELHVVMIPNDNSYTYAFNIFLKDSSGKIVNKPFKVVVGGKLFVSDVAYYKWEPDSLCLVKLLKNGNLQAEVELIYFNDSTQSLRVKETK